MRWLAIQMIGFYRRFLSPLLGARCRFYPSCSAYAMECFEKIGFFRATWKVFTRLIRCHPFHPGGYDPVETPKESSVSKPKMAAIS